ncbi:hypothetical protein BDF19DRAFT_474363 [Syncephalis fuscata]|nr:hypothetical protein BDF19DRAFT_474363 [Syncephalis fuscata]
MIFHNTFTISTFAAALLLVSSIQDITKVQAIFPSSIKDSAQQLALYFKPKQTKRQKDFYGYPLGQNIAFGNYKLILEKSSTSNNEISYASGYLLDKNGQADQAIDILCGHVTKTIRTVEKPSDWKSMDRKFLLYQYSQVKDKSIFRSVDFSFIDEYNPKSGHICYMTKSTGNSYQFPSPEFRKILQKNIQPIYILINQLRKSILFAEKLGWYYKLEPECVVFNDKFQVTIRCIEGTYNAKYESNKKNTRFNTQEYDENMKYYFHQVLVMTGFGTIKLRQAVELYTEGLLFNGRSISDKSTGSFVNIKPMYRK